MVVDPDVKDLESRVQAEIGTRQFRFWVLILGPVISIMLTTGFMIWFRGVPLRLPDPQRVEIERKIEVLKQELRDLP